jgi:hypothetical protein
MPTRQLKQKCHLVCKEQKHVLNAHLTAEFPHVRQPIALPNLFSLPGPSLFCRHLSPQNIYICQEYLGHSPVLPVHRSHVHKHSAVAPPSAAFVRPLELPCCAPGTVCSNALSRAFMQSSLPISYSGLGRSKRVITSCPPSSHVTKVWRKATSPVHQTHCTTLPIITHTMITKATESSPWYIRHSPITHKYLGVCVSIACTCIHLQHTHIITENT